MDIWIRKETICSPWIEAQPFTTLSEEESIAEQSEGMQRVKQVQHLEISAEDNPDRMIFFSFTILTLSNLSIFRVWPVCSLRTF